jgi:NAD(P)-dependent dehydrogenase (short-subunit alcohol dehydrogenase family)
MTGAAQQHSATTAIVRFAYHSPLTPARVMRRLRAPALETMVADRVIVVTGASSGIGRAAALRLAAAGANVLLVARTAEVLNELAECVREHGGAAQAYPCDVRDHEAVEHLAAEILDRHGRVDALINNAGRSIRRPIHDS